MNSRRPSADEIFEQAQQLSGDARAAFLKEAAGGDEPLRQRIEKLLQADDNAGDFLNQPAAASAGTLVITAGMIPVTEKPGDKIGRYKLREQIGEGGCGVVYVADQEEPVRRRVALKIIKLGMDTKQVVARFEAERQALALMDHPNIARVLDAGATDTGRPYFVMELVRGIRITDYCDKNNLSTEERLKLFIQVCSAIQHAHQKGIIHRDIKPSNILVTLHDGVPVPKVIDFGIAKATTDQRLTDKTIYTAFEQFIGTPAYMSPEQAEMSGLDIDTRSDIYSLGVLLYELLTGRTPFDAATLLKAGLDQMRRIIREQEPQRPSTRLSTLEDADLTEVASHRRAEPPKLLNLLRGDLDWIVMQALEKDRTRRYDTANGFAQDILRYLNSEPVVARPPSAGYRFQKFARRNTLPLAATGVVATALVVGLGLSVWSLTRERQARRMAVTERQRADAQAKEARTALAASDLHQAVQFLAEGKDDHAFAYLARSLKNNPTNEGTADRLAILLASRSWQLPALSLPHRGLVHSAEFSPDGKRVLTTSQDSTARVWDVQTGQPLTELLQHGATVWRAQFSPDGKRVVTASSDRTARVWDAQTGQPLTEPLSHAATVWRAQFSPDGERVLTASDDFTARLWDAQTGQLLAERFKHAGEVLSAEFSSDGKRIVTGSRDGTARVWDAQTGQPLTKPLRHNSSGVSDRLSPDDELGWRAVGLPGEGVRAQFSPDGNLVVTDIGYTVRVWDSQTGQPLTKPFGGLGESRAVTFSPDSKWIVAAFDDRGARVWNAMTGQPVSPLLEHGSWIASAEFSPDGKWIVTASRDRTARVWDAQTGQLLTKGLTHGAEVYSARFSPEGKRVVTASWDNTARVWVLTMPPKSDPAWLLPLAEALSAETLSDQGELVASKARKAEAAKEVRRLLIQEPEGSEWVAWGRWVLAEPLEQTISPFSKVTMREYIERLIAEGIAEGSLEKLEKAGLLAAGNGGLQQRIVAARRRLDQIEQAWRVVGQGRTLRQQGKPFEAEAAYREALAIREGIPSVRHLEIIGVTQLDEAELLTEFASVLRDVGKLSEAEVTYRKALAIHNEHPGNAARDVAATVAGLALVLRQQGKLAEAEATYTGITNVASAGALGSLALELVSSTNSELRNGRIAVLLAEKAVALTERKDVMILQTLAAAYAENGEFEKAVQVEKEAIAFLQVEENWRAGAEARLKIYESKHRLQQEAEMHRLNSEAKSFLSSYGAANAESEALYRKALAIRRDLSGTNDLETASAIDRLAGQLRGRRECDLSEEESLLRESLAIRRKLLGSEHPEVASSLNKLAMTLERLQRPGEAEALYREVLAIQSKSGRVEGGEHSRALRRLAGLLATRNSLTEVESLYREDLTLNREWAKAGLGSDVVSALNRLADVLERQGKLTEAKTLQDEARSFIENKSAIPATPK